MNANINVGINIIVVKENRLLLGKRKNVFGAGEWGLPGGHLEFGEGFKAAAARELKEETGLTASEFIFENIVNQPRENEHYIQIAFSANGIADEPQVLEPDRCEAWQWFDLNSLPQNTFSAHKNQIELFKEKRNFTE